MKYHELPEKYKREARQWAMDGWNEIYAEQSIPPLATDDSPEVLQTVEDWEYEIERGEYEPGVGYERLVRI